jgi:hypothetical protein
MIKTVLRRRYFNKRYKKKVMSVKIRLSFDWFIVGTSR